MAEWIFAVLLLLFVRAIVIAVLMDLFQRLLEKENCSSRSRVAIVVPSNRFAKKL
jgi:predicted PurR-regulated permease PerM